MEEPRHPRRIGKPLITKFIQPDPQILNLDRPQGKEIRFHSLTRFRVINDILAVSSKLMSCPVRKISDLYFVTAAFIKLLNFVQSEPDLQI